MAQAADSPVLSVSATKVYANATFYLSWDASGAESLSIWRSANYQEFAYIGSADPAAGEYTMTEPDTGVYEYTIMVYQNGDWAQSNICGVTVIEAPAPPTGKDPIIHVDKTEAYTNEVFTLSWYFPEAESCTLWRSFNYQEFEALGYIDTCMVAYEVTPESEGVYDYVVMVAQDDEWLQSNTCSVSVTAGPAQASTDFPFIYCHKTEVGLNESFYLSWNMPNAESCSLWRSFNGQGYESLGSQDPVTSRYEITADTIGTYEYLIIVYQDGQWLQSDGCRVRVTADEDTTCAILRQRGMTNSWNLLFMVYRTVQIGSYSRTFSDAQISSMRQIASEIKYTMEGLSNGRMRIGSVDLIVVDEPITSASYNAGYGGPPALTYGPDGDVDFNYILDHKDITLVAVVAPLLGMNDQYGWLGLGGTYMTVRNHRLYTIIVNEIYTSGNRIECDGNGYLEDAMAFVHEMLHAVETNSDSNGWSSFEELHGGDNNPEYEIGSYEWYHDLMRNTLKNGHYGFLKQSYYVSHLGIADSMSSGTHTDYDGVTRYYVNGLPKYAFDFVLPAFVDTVEEEAFWNIPARKILVPASAVSIGWHAFPAGATLYGEAGSCAEDWASSNGYAFVPLAK